MIKHLLLKLFIILCLLFTLKVNSYTNNIPTIKESELMGLLNLNQNPNLINIEKIGLPVNKKDMVLNKETAYALKRAYDAFKLKHKDIPFIIISATRNYYYQKQIWDKKWNKRFFSIKNEYKTAKNILLYSSMPGTSRHHWGTDFDITSLESSYFKKNPQGKILNRWLIKNMPLYGFCKPYNNNRKGGYQPEEWHWSYKPLSSIYIKEYKKIFDNNFESILSEIDFLGSKNLPIKELINEYVFTINKDCY